MTDEPMEFTPGHEAELKVDAYGRKRSARSTPTGPGSRGGRLHDPTYRAGYDAGWRAGNPAYRARERERARQLQIQRDRASVEAHEPVLTDTEKRVLAALVVHGSYAPVAACLGIKLQTVKNHALDARRKAGTVATIPVYAELDWLRVPVEYEHVHHNQRRTRADDPADNVVAGPRPFEAAS